MPNPANSPIGTPTYFYTHKEAESPKDYQDSRYVNLEFGRYAVADGATKSFFPAQWAELLVEHFCTYKDPLNKELFDHKKWQIWLRPVQKEWNRRIKKMVDEAPASKYYVKNRYAKREPAFATFVGVQIDITNEKEISWQAMIVGDSCLFHVHQDKIKRSYLIQDSKQFDHHPELFSSVDSYNNKSHPTFTGGIVQDGDFLILATDAIAKWILTHDEKGTWPEIWPRLKNMTEGKFHPLIHQARRDPETPLENDDVTLMIIPIKELTPSPSITQRPSITQNRPPSQTIQETPKPQEAKVEEPSRSTVTKKSSSMTRAKSPQQQQTKVEEPSRSTTSKKPSSITRAKSPQQQQTKVEEPSRSTTSKKPSSMTKSKSPQPQETKVEEPSRSTTSKKPSSMTKSKSLFSWLMTRGQNLVDSPDSVSKPDSHQAEDDQRIAQHEKRPLLFNVTLMALFALGLLLLVSGIILMVKG